MKKILLSILAVSTFTMAQAQLFSAADSADFTQFTQVDADGDTIGFEFVTFAASGSAALDAQGDVLMGESWRAGTILFPDNYLISPAIDLTGQTSLQLTWSAMVTDADYPAEHYSVYVVTNVNQVMGATALFEETLTAADVTPGKRTLDISQFAGEATVYFAFRHHDVSDQYRFFLDDFTVASSVGLEENEISVSVYPNPVMEVLTFNINEEVQIIEVYTTAGVLVKKTTSKEINVADLTEGAYLYNVLTKSGKVSNGTFVKK